MDREITTKANHCVTCTCGDPTSLDNWNAHIQLSVRRCQAALRISETVQARLALTELYRFGFTGLKLTTRTASAGGQFLCALLVDPAVPRSQTRFAHVATVGWLYMAEDGLCNPPLKPHATEYTRGDVFDLPNLPQLGDLADWHPSDDDLDLWVMAHMQPLVEWAEQVAVEMGTASANVA